MNFAFITKSGKAHAPADPTTVFQPPFDAITPNPRTDLFMGSGDKLIVDMHDTPAGFQVEIKDLTTGQTGSMTASRRNGFAQVKFDPTASTCTTIPYAFHPMYATSSEHTRVPWAAHSYNVSFSDEIGHFEYCNEADPATGACTEAGASDPGGLDDDDAYCFNAEDSPRIKIGGCLDTDVDFDGPAYSTNWPGSIPNVHKDTSLHPSPILFSSPRFRPNHGDGLKDYSRVGFEADLPRIEAPDFGGICDRSTGANCVNPPPGASFYPIYTTTKKSGQCLAAGWAVHPGNHEHVRWHVHGGIRSAAADDVRFVKRRRVRQPLQQLPADPVQEPLHIWLSRGLAQRPGHIACTRRGGACEGFSGPASCWPGHWSPVAPLRARLPRRPRMSSTTRTCT